MKIKSRKDVNLPSLLLQIGHLFPWKDPKELFDYRHHQRRKLLTQYDAIQPSLSVESDV